MIKLLNVRIVTVDIFAKKELPDQILKMKLKDICVQPDIFVQKALKKHLHVRKEHISTTPELPLKTNANLVK